MARFLFQINLQCYHPFFNRFPNGFNSSFLIITKEVIALEMKSAAEMSFKVLREALCKCCLQVSCRLSKELVNWLPTLITLNMKFHKSISSLSNKLGLLKFFTS